MHSLNEYVPIEFPFPKQIKYVVCCDLDETYIPFLEADKKYGGISALENFMCKHGVEKGIVIGWITGTNLSSAIRKSRGYISYSPHFICCSLGTEFYWVKQGLLHPSSIWQKKIESTGFKKECVDQIVSAAGKKGIVLARQSEDYQGPFKASYYYKEGNDFAADLAWLEQTAAQYGIRALLTKCNPAAGDPMGCYDADFIPACCGKDEAVDFVSNQLFIPKDKVIAFGDSCNDFPMFSRSGRSFLIGNAALVAKEQMGHHLEKPYCHGILSVLQELN
jgi:kanosamine-6-phosphate phosphatase